MINTAIPRYKLSFLDMKERKDLKKH